MARAEAWLSVIGGGRAKVRGEEGDRGTERGACHRRDVICGGRGGEFGGGGLQRERRSGRSAGALARRPCVPGRRNIA